MHAKPSHKPAGYEAVGGRTPTAAETIFFTAVYHLKSDGFSVAHFLRPFYYLGNKISCTLLNNMQLEHFLIFWFLLFRTYFYKVGQFR